MSTPKPRAFKTDDGRIRGECLILEDGERVVDARIDLYDDKTAAGDLARYAKWLSKAAKWLGAKTCTT